MRNRSRRKPLLYYVFWAILVVICLALIWSAWQNTLPYQAVVKKLFKINDAGSTKIVQILWFRVQLSLSWFVGAIFWAFVQGLQITYLLITQSERALDFLIQKANSKKTYEESDKDDRTLAFAKRKYNSLPLATLNYLLLGCIFAYSVELFVNLNSFPIFNGGLVEMLYSAFLFEWDKFDIGNLAMILLTMFAVEGLVFAGIIFYRIIEVFRESEAYKPKTQRFY